MIPACAAPHINSPNADTANMLFLGTSGLSSISDMSDRGQKLPPSSASVLQLMANSSGIRQIRQVTSIPPELGHNRHRISRRCQDRLLPVLVVRGLSGAAGRANRRYAAILSPAAGEPASVVDVVQDFLEVFPGFALGFLIVLAQQPPSAQITLGPIASSCRWRNWPQISISSGSGLRFSGGRHFTTLQM